MTAFSWLMAQVYDRSIQKAEIRCLRDWRIALLSNLSGRVLEIGCGTGLNLDHYPQTVQHLTLLEPDFHMRKKLVKKISLMTQGIHVETLNCSAELIPVADD